MATTLASQVQELYVGYLGRAADKAGLDFWVKAIENGTSTLESVALGFTLSEEYKAQYNGLTTTQLVAKVYQNVLGRAADADGLAFWAGEVNKGVIKADTLVKSMINSLGAIDQLTIDNKVTAANAYTIAAGDKYSVEAGKAAVVNAGTTVPGTSTPGQTFTLTNGTDTLHPQSAVAGSKTTEGDDTIRATANGHLGTADNIDGGNGNDTINAVVAATASATIQPVIANVENINIDATVTAAAAKSATAATTVTWTMNFADVTGEKVAMVKASDITATAGASAATADATATVAFTNLTLGTVVGIQDSTLTATPTAGTKAATANAVVSFGFASASGSSDAATLKLADVAVAGNGTKVVQVNNIETLTVESNAGTVAGTTTNTVDISADSAGSIVITGAQTLNTTITAALATSIDASSATGAMNLTFVATQGATTVKSGSGSDTLTLNGAVTQALTIDAGAGNDTIIMDGTNAKAITVTGGAGSDVFRFDADIANIAGITNDAAILTNVITIADFAAGDKIDLSNNGDILAITETVRDSIGAGKATLKAALDAAAALTTSNGAGNSVVWFKYDGNTYVYQETANTDVVTGVEVNDGLIKIAGLHDLVTTDFV